MVVMSDRYSGSYSGFLWIALDCEAPDVPWQIDADDAACMNFWHRAKQEKGTFPYSRIGLGNTPDEAVNSLKEKLK